jgi:hypothetical protein
LARDQHGRKIHKSVNQRARWGAVTEAQRTIQKEKEWFGESHRRRGRWPLLLFVFFVDIILKRPIRIWMDKQARGNSRSCVSGGGLLAARIKSAGPTQTRRHRRHHENQPIKSPCLNARIKKEALTLTLGRGLRVQVPQFCVQAPFVAGINHSVLASYIRPAAFPLYAHTP